MRLMKLRTVAGVFVGLLFSQAVMAAPALILLEGRGSGNSVQRDVVEKLGTLAVTNNLGRIYDHIDVLSGADATREVLFAQIRKRGAKRDVDVVILGSGAITEQDVRAAGPFLRLRLVFMMAAHSASMQGAWLDVGARTFMGHEDVNRLSGFYFPRFLRRWSEGASARTAAADAYRFSEATGALLAPYTKEDEHQSEPVLAGVDLDRFGRTYPQQAQSVTATKPVGGISLETFQHSDFGHVGLSVLAAMIPQATLEIDAIPSAQLLVDRVGGVAWDALHDSFPHPLNRGDVDIIPGLDLPTRDGEEIWIDGEALRYLLGSVAGTLGDKLAPVLEHIQGLRMTRQGDALNAAVYFDRAFTLPLQDERKIGNWQPYAVTIPKTIRFAIRMLDGVLMLSGLDRESNSIHLKLKMPFLPDTVWVRSASVNMDDGKLKVEAGVLRNVITIVARAEIVARKFSGVDIWESIKRNLRLFVWPVLLFERK